MSLESLLQKLQEQHQNELQQLEEGLQEFYSAEWEKTHQAYQKEADKCRVLMQQQVSITRAGPCLHHRRVKSYVITF